MSVGMPRANRLRVLSLSRLRRQLPRQREPRAGMAPFAQKKRDLREEYGSFSSGTVFGKQKGSPGGGALCSEKNNAQRSSAR